MDSRRLQTEKELDAIRERYSRRHKTYHALDRWVAYSRQERERAISDFLVCFGLQDTADRRLLEVGCGSGDNLLFFLRLGFRASNLFGNELLENRCREAREKLPHAVTLIPGNAGDIGGDRGLFDIVFQSMMFSSILDDGVRHDVARKMWSLLKPGGVVISYDFVYNNPANPDVRKISVGDLRSLFPQARLHSRRVTLAPPISRRVAPLGFWAYVIVNALIAFRTHALCCLLKPPL